MKRIVFALLIVLFTASAAYAEPFAVNSDSNDYLGYAPWAEGYKLGASDFDVKSVSILPYSSYNAKGITGMLTVDLPNVQGLELSTSIINLANLNNSQALDLGVSQRINVGGTDANVGFSIITTDPGSIIKGTPQLDTLQVNGRLEF